MAFTNVDYKPYKGTNAWRKITIGTWPYLGDPSIYGWVDIDANGVIETLKHYQDQNIKLSPTTITAKAVSVAIASYHPVNGVVRLGRIYQRKSVDVFLQVAPDGTGENLSGITIRDCDKKSLLEIHNEIKEKAGRIKAGDDREFEKVRKTMDLIPGWMMSTFLKFISFLQYGLNFWSPLMGSPRDGFGSAMVTSVGMLGLQRGFAPLVPYSRCPIVITVGKIEQKPIVKNGKIEVGEILPICATMDHRLIDGVGASKIFKAFSQYLEKPY